ncbi:MAG: DUF123 domain-containing protein [Acidimicrobiales bacterium]
MLDPVPTRGGTYVLCLRVDRAGRRQVGRLGDLAFEAGSYLYVGSAFGPGGLRARLGHHLGAVDRPRWHLDHLREIAVPVEIWWAEVAVEHDWARALAAVRGARPPHRGFGSSDCACPSHLVHRSRAPARSTMARHLRPSLGRVRLRRLLISDS